MYCINPNNFASKYRSLWLKINSIWNYNGEPTYINLFSNWVFLFLLLGAASNQPPIFQDDMTNHVLNEDTKVGSIVYTLKGYDPENSEVRYGILGTDLFSVNATTGEVRLEKPLDREVSIFFLRHQIIYTTLKLISCLCF